MFSRAKLNELLALLVVGLADQAIKANTYGGRLELDQMDFIELL